jgi:hypothetical protein
VASGAWFLEARLPGCGDLRGDSPGDFLGFVAHQCRDGNALRRPRGGHGGPCSRRHDRLPKILGVTAALVGLTAKDLFETVFPLLIAAIGKSRYADMAPGPAAKPAARPVPGGQQGCRCRRPRAEMEKAAAALTAVLGSWAPCAPRPACHRIDRRCRGRGLGRRAGGSWSLRAHGRFPCHFRGRRGVGRPPGTSRALARASWLRAPAARGCGRYRTPRPRLLPGLAAAVRLARRPGRVRPGIRVPHAGRPHDHEGSAAHLMFFLHQTKRRSRARPGVARPARNAGTTRHAGPVGPVATHRERLQNSRKRATSRDR